MRYVGRYGIVALSAALLLLGLVAGASASDTDHWGMSDTDHWGM